MKAICFWNTIVHWTTAIAQTSVFAVFHPPIRHTSESSLWESEDLQGKQSSGQALSPAAVNGWFVTHLLHRQQLQRQNSGLWIRPTDEEGAISTFLPNLTEYHHYHPSLAVLFF